MCSTFVYTLEEGILISSLRKRACREPVMIHSALVCRSGLAAGDLVGDPMIQGDFRYPGILRDFSGSRVAGFLPSYGAASVSNVESMNPLVISVPFGSDGVARAGRSASFRIREQATNKPHHPTPRGSLVLCPFVTTIFTP